MSASERDQDGDEGAERARLEETFRRLAREPHAAADFHDAVMRRAALLPPPRPSWRQRLSNLNVASVFRYRYVPALAAAAVLLCCLAGLGYLYRQVTHLQSVHQQEQQLLSQREAELEHLRQELATQQQAIEQTLTQVTRAEREALSGATLDAQPPAQLQTAPEDSSAESIVVRTLAAAKSTLKAASRILAQIQQHLTPEASDRDAAEDTPKP